MKQITIIGMGGTGSHLFPALMNYAHDGDYAFHLWDADRVENKNLARQGFYPWEVGMFKVHAIAERWQDADIITYTEYVGETRIGDSIRDGDTVFICADNMAVRRIIDKHAQTLDNITVINGGNEEWDGSVQVYVRQDGKNLTPPISFNSPEFDPSNESPDMATLSCAEIAELPGGAQTVVANHMVASLMLMAFARVERGIYVPCTDCDDPVPQWTKVTFDTVSGTVQTSDVRLVGGIDV